MMSRDVTDPILPPNTHGRVCLTKEPLHAQGLAQDTKWLPPLEEEECLWGLG